MNTSYMQKLTWILKALLREKSQSQRSRTIRIHLLNHSQNDKITDVEKRLVVARG